MRLPYMYVSNEPVDAWVRINTEGVGGLALSGACDTSG